MENLEYNRAVRIPKCKRLEYWWAQLEATFPYSSIPFLPQPVRWVGAVWGLTDLVQ